MHIFCRIAYKGSLLVDIYKVFDNGDVWDEEGNLCSFQIGPDYHIVEVL